MGAEVVSSARVEAATAAQINGSGACFHGYVFWLGRCSPTGARSAGPPQLASAASAYSSWRSSISSSSSTASSNRSAQQTKVPLTILNTFALKVAASAQ